MTNTHTLAQKIMYEVLLPNIYLCTHIELMSAHLFHTITVVIEQKLQS